MLVAQLCPTFCDPADCSPPAASVHGIFQARILELVTIPSPKYLLDTGMNLHLLHGQADSLPSEPAEKPIPYLSLGKKKKKKCLPESNLQKELVLKLYPFPGFPGCVCECGGCSSVSHSLWWGRCVNFAVFLKGTDVTWDRLLTFIEPKFPQY